MCEECRTHKIECAQLMLARATPEQIRRLIRDILASGETSGGSAA